MINKFSSKTTIITAVIVVSIGAISIVWADKAKKREIAEQEEQLRLEQIEIQKEIERNKPIVGAKEESVKKHGYDSRLIANKLNTYDYSNNGDKMVFLTFDDGPSTTNTPGVLDILNKHNVKGTFFIKGNSLEKEGADKILKRTFNEGHSIAHHSYSHDYNYLYPNRTLNIDNFANEIAKTDKAIKNVLGEKFSSNVLRCPGGHMSWKNMDPLDKHLEEKDMVSIDWNALNADAEGKKKNSDALFEYTKKTSENKDIVVLLMHDTYGKEETVKSLDQIITHFKDSGYSFKILV
ncbi:polysaccharide deacetylase [Romboutsia weinsteinii]|uniref:Polysaccharide deacetylase n=1 Tax=Romboutsia weinsteinii TaxID=2020949 RepID=A0A371J1U3_9FIRM|nr:polysaccharide deacetylase family protein [Romboutsia weinsteinii]RDY26781.1 polysaccharide deacetylase [Romboutsia weinsteinii]